jgi:lipopolysaccharide/colanic/teichoic acid biosynthesis glycosyltransferase
LIKRKNNFYINYLKRGLDLAIVIPSLFLSLPIFLVILLIYAFRKENPFFFQERLGKNGKIFVLFKFRTMREPKANESIHDPQRITSFGKILRKTSLDELPQLFNVLLGQMSLVGPRPLLPEYLPLYNEHQKKRMLVKPGITGYAQIQGRNALSWKEKFNFDIYYVEHANFWLDIYILLMTPFSLNGNETPEPFNGKN